MGSRDSHIHIEEICRERRIVDPHMGTIAHMQEVFLLIQSSPVFVKKMERVKLGRWASWFNAAKAWRGSKQPLLLILLFMGTKKGWWKSWQQMPIFDAKSQLLPVTEDDQPSANASVASAPGSSRSPVVAPAMPHSVSSSSSSSAVAAGSSSAVSAPAGRPSSPPPPRPRATVSAPSSSQSSAIVQPRSIKDSNVEVRKLRGTVNTLHFCAKILSNTFGNKVAECVCAATLPSCEMFDRAKTILKTKEGSRQWHEWAAKGGYDDIMQKTFGIFEDSSVLETIGFTSEDQSEYMDDMALSDEGHLAELLLHLCSQESFSFLLSTFTWSDLLPGKFILLVSLDPQVVKVGLSELKSWWELLLVCEEGARDNVWATNIWKNMNWPMRTYDREILIMLSEDAFSRVSPEVQGLIEGFAFSWLQSNINEDCMNRYRARSSAQSAGEFNRVSRWHVAQSSRLLEDYDRRAVKVTTAARSAVKGSPPADLFEPSKEHFSLGHDSLTSMSDKSDYPHQSPQALKQRGLIWHALRSLRGDFEKLGRAWLSLLVSPGFIVQEILPQNTVGHGCQVFKSNLGQAL